jgi:bifunctional DNA-binding transcriptional regulator/antitoxin component of YhaV-PrlF toxin-antitoxin module
MVKTCEALVMDDGHLSITEEVRHAMDLQRGERVEVTIRRFPVAVPPENPLAKMIGLCGGIEKSDLSINHDFYLYKEDNP